MTNKNGSVLSVLFHRLCERSWAMHYFYGWNWCHWYVSLILVNTSLALQENVSFKARGLHYHFNSLVPQQLCSLRGRRKKGSGRGREKSAKALSPQSPSLFPFLPIPYPLLTPAMQANNFGDFLVLQMGVINKLCITKDSKDSEKYLNQYTTRDQQWFLQHLTPTTLLTG